MWRPVAITVLALALAGCGSSEEGRDATSSAAFIRCFDVQGFEAVRPAPREESVLVFQARRNGFDVEAVNIRERGLSPSAFIALFEDADEAARAMRELGATSYGQVPPQQVGEAVVGYGDEANRRELEAGIQRCVAP